MRGILQPWDILIEKREIMDCRLKRPERLLSLSLHPGIEPIPTEEPVVWDTQRTPWKLVLLFQLLILVLS